MRTLGHNGLIMKTILSSCSYLTAGLYCTYFDLLRLPLKVLKQNKNVYLLGWEQSNGIGMLMKI